MEQPVLPLVQNLKKKMLDAEMKHEHLMETYKEYLKGQYLSNCITFWSKSSKNIGMKNSGYTTLAFRKDWWRFCESTKWIEPYCLLAFFYCTPVLENGVNSEIEGLLWFKRE